MFRMLDDGGPETMINTEVWLPAGFSLEYWLSGHHVTNAGPLGSSGRYVGHTSVGCSDHSPLVSRLQ